MQFRLVLTACDEGMNETGTRYVLLVDDDEDDQMLFKDMFTKVSHDLGLHVVSSGIEAIAYLNSCQGALPSLLVLDYNIPPLNGAEIIKELNNCPHFSGIPKVIVSTSEYIRDECLNAGALQCFIKPSNLDKFIEIMHEILQHVS